jgi:hypothetical protein
MHLSYAAAGMRAVIFVSTACQPEKLALMTQAGAWVYPGPGPAGAAALAGLERAIEVGLADRSETVVLLVTGREVKRAGPRPTWAGSRSPSGSTRSSGPWRGTADGHPAASNCSPDRPRTTTGRG